MGPTFLFGIETEIVKTISVSIPDRNLFGEIENVKKK